METWGDKNTPRPPPLPPAPTQRLRLRQCVVIIEIGPQYVIEVSECAMYRDRHGTCVYLM